MDIRIAIEQPEPLIGTEAADEQGLCPFEGWLSGSGCFSPASNSGAALLVAILLAVSAFQRAPRTGPAGDTAVMPADLACKDLVDLVTDYLDGVLPADRRAGLEDHLGECDGCSEHVQQIRLTIQALKGLRAADSPQQVAGTTNRTSG